MKPTGLALLTLLGVAFASTPLYAAVPAKFSFPVARAPHPMALDPTLADPAWASGAVPNGTGPWEDVTTRGPAEHATTAYLLYDDQNLYVAFKAEQSGTAITATQSTNDIGFGIDDFVGIGIDTSGGGSQAYYYETTPRGVRYEQANENVRYRPRWQAAAKVVDGSWNAVMIIPLSVLKIGGGGDQTWGIELVRGVAARGEHYAWAFNGIMLDAPSGTWPVFTDVRWWGSATGLKLVATRGHGRADIYGLGSAGADRNLFQQANGTFSPEKIRVYGVDVSLPITPTISFVGTANPDFSNVEIDQQTIAPQEFQRQLVEYRPFFAQGSSFINASSGARTPAGGITTAPNLVFYSPDIGPFDWGTKAEGTFGKQSFGALAFRGFDETTGNTFADEAFGYEHALSDGTFYYWSDGVLAHHSLAGDDSTIETGIEGRNYHNGLVWFFDHSFEDGSWVPQGHASFTQGSLDIHKPFFEIFTSYMDTTANYNPIDGYTPISDVRGPMAFVNFVGSTPGIKNWTWFNGGDRFVDATGAVHQADTQSFLNVVFKNNFSIDGAGVAVGQLRSYGIPAGPGCSGPIVAETTFTGYPCYRDGTTSPYNFYTLPVGYGDGTSAPVDADYQWGPFGSDYVHLFTLSTTRPIARTITLGLNYDGTYERAFSTGALSSQWLRSVSLGLNLSTESTFTVALRDINGYGGFATQIGNNLAVAFHERFKTGNEIYVNYGSPAAGATLNRLIVKYVFHAGADAGT